MKNKLSINILIVEDEVLLAYASKEMLIDMGFSNISIVGTMERAKIALETTKVDLALLDINLGNGNEGLELAKKCFMNDVPFLYISSYTDQKTLDLALETAPGAYVVKPIIPVNLYSAINITLRNNKQTEDGLIF